MEGVAGSLLSAGGCAPDEDDSMNCVACKNGETEMGQTTVTLERGDTVYIVRGVPAEICRQCGEYSVDEDVADRLLREGERAFATGAEVVVQRFAA